MKIKKTDFSKFIDDLDYVIQDTEIVVSIIPSLIRLNGAM